MTDQDPSTDDPFKAHRAFVRHVHEQCATPAGRAALRSALAEMDRPYRAYEYMLSRVPQNAGRESTMAYVLVAGMYAEQAPNPRLAARGTARRVPAGLAGPVDGERWRNLGWSLHRAVQAKAMPADWAKDRLQSLARQEFPGLLNDLPGLVGRLRGADVPVTWPLLLKDVLAWQRWPEDTADRWMRGFYPNTDTADAESAAGNTGTTEEN